MNDVLTEVYGYAKARSVIWWGFLVLALTSLLFYIAVALPPAAFYEDQPAFARLFGFVPRIALASLAAYLVGSFLNAYVMSQMKVKTGGKHLWTRTIGSTIVGEGVDSVIFNFVAFLGVFPFRELVFIALSGFVLKTAYEVLATPLTYAVVNKMKRIEGVDAFDRGIDYNPFKMAPPPTHAE